jgi:copper homeostasis protein
LNQNPVLIEACVDTVESAVAAQIGGAHRVELCDNLREGGTTPSAGMIGVVRERITIGLHVLIRPRAGDFCYADSEIEVMMRDIALARQIGADGVALGTLNPDGSVAESATRALIDAARPLSVTFHRAFDVTRDPAESLESLIRLGVDRVLTSGQVGTAEDGIATIASLVAQAAGRIVILAGGGLNEGNVRRIVSQTGVCEIHLSAASLQPGRSRYRNERVTFRKPFTPDEYSRPVTDPDRIKRIASLLE